MSHGGFQLAGSAAERYQQVLVPYWFGHWARELVALVAPSPGESILDVACGTGVTTRMLKEAVGPGGRVAGLDINAPMLVVARELSRGLDIDWLEDDVCSGAIGGARFDAVVSQHGYHYFPDKAEALAAMRRALVPGGRIALSVWDGHSPYTRALCDALELVVAAGIVAPQRAQRETPSAQQLSRELAAAGFDEVRVERQVLDIRVPPVAEWVPLHLSCMPIAEVYRGLPEAERNRVVDAVADSLAGYATADALVYPDAVHVAIGHD